jgi:outer membrane protein assembly factor BamD
MGRFMTITAILAVIASLGACAGGSRRKPGSPDNNDDEADRMAEQDRAGFGEPGRGENVPSVSYAETAEENWQLAEDAFNDEDYLAAQRYYGYIRSKYPYSKYTALAELRIGDCQFARGRHLEAIDTFQNFRRLHPTHERVAYAAYKAALCFYEQMPTDWFLLPPSEEKEQTAVRDAERALREYIDLYPNDENIEDAKKRLTEVRKRLLAHERYVANFYKRLGKDRAYVGRLQVIRKNFPDVGLDDGLLLEIASVYAKLGQVEDAQSAVKELEQKFPTSAKLSEARALLNGAAKPAPVPEPEAPKDAPPPEQRSSS